MSSNSLYDKKIQTLNSLFIYFIAIVIFYGAFRKWIFPSLSNVFYFAPELFLAYIYMYAINHRLFPFKKIDILFYGIFFGLLVLIIVQAFIYQTFIVLAFGWRNYCFMLPFVVLLYTYMNEKTLNRLAVFFCLVAIPTAILVFIQSNSPVDSFINKSVGEGDVTIFVVAKGVVRTTGFFSFNTGHSLFTFGAIGLFIFQVFKEGKRLPSYILILSGICILIGVVVSGSRGNVVVTGFSVGIMILSQLGTLKYKKSAYTLLIGLILGIAGFIFVSFFLSSNVENLNERFETADSFWDRIGGLFLGVATPFTIDLPLLGYGLGVSSSGAMVNSGLNLPIDFSFEHEWARFFVETGLFIGFILTIFRISLSFFMIWAAFKTFNYNRNPGILVLVAVFFMNMFVGQMSMNALSMYFGWYFFAVIVAMYRIERAKKETHLNLL